MVGLVSKGRHPNVSLMIFRILGGSEATKERALSRSIPKRFFVSRDKNDVGLAEIASACSFKKADGF